jgi:glutathione S-transferase
MRAWLALGHAGADFEISTAHLPHMDKQSAEDGHLTDAVNDLPERRQMGSVTGLFPVLWVDGAPIHEALAICEWVAEAYPEANLWPADALARAQARAACCEMASGFSNIRGDLSCHPFARVPGYVIRPETQREIDRVFEIWQTQLERHGGPYLAGDFGILDCMYYPMLTRFRTYGVELPETLEHYAGTLEGTPLVKELQAIGRAAPRIAVYDAYVVSLGGEPDAALTAPAGH